MVSQASDPPVPSLPGPCLITGSSSGIGRAIALRLARESAPVYASARKLASIADLAEHGCRPIELDVADEASRANAIRQIESEFGAVAALVNNAGYGQQGPLEETPLDAIRAQFETNFYGVIGLCQLVLPGMRRAGAGRIVNLSSMGGRITFPGGGAYHASKYALEAMSDVLRFEVAGFGIRVIVLEPGPTASAFGRASIETLQNREDSADAAYRDFRAGIRNALKATFESPPEGATTPEAVAEAVYQALTAADPEPRVVVGAMAEELIRLKESSSARAWDEVVGQMYPQPRPRDPSR